MANISKLNGYDIKDAVARNDLSRLKMGLSQPDRNLLKVDINFSDYPNNPTFVYMQGGCYNNLTDRFVIAYTDASNVNDILVELDNNFTVVRRSVSLPLGHANDLTFNPKTNKIYVATGNTGVYAGKIVEIDATTLTFSSAITLDSVPVVWQISYDELNDRYFVDGSSSLCIYDSSFNLIKMIPHVYDFIGTGEMVYQSSFVYEGSYILICFSQNVTTNINFVYLATIDENALTVFAKYPTYNAKDEIESICIKNGVGYGFHGQRCFRVSIYDFSRAKFIEPEHNSSMYSSIRIPDNSDMNNYMINGIYNVPAKSDAETMANIPQSIGGNLIVEPQSEYFIRQRYITTLGNEYVRVFNTDNKTWTNWQNQLYSRQPDYNGVASKCWRLRNNTTYHIAIPKGNFKLLIGATTWDAFNNANDYAEYIVCSPTAPESGSSVAIIPLRTSTYVTNLVNAGSDRTATNLTITCSNTTARDVLAIKMLDDRTVVETVNS